MSTAGVRFPDRNGHTSTSGTGRDVFATAAGAADQALADRIAETANWRKGYVAAVRDVVAVGSRSSRALREVAQAGLGRIEEEFEFTDGPETLSAYEAVQAFAAGPEYVTRTFVGRDELDAAFAVPVDGEERSGDALRSILRQWWNDDVVERSFVHALDSLIDQPQWLDLSGVNVILLGAGAELSPLRQLLQWGATVYAIDIPSPSTWQRILKAVEGTAGTLHVPIPASSAESTNSDETAAVAGIDLIAAAPSAARWLSTVPSGPTVLANYGYADGADNARLSVACDAIAAALMKERGTKDFTLAYLATPTDAFQVPSDVVAAAREKWSHKRVARLTRLPLKPVNLYQPNYQYTVLDDQDREVGIADCLIEQQGPNYVLAKRLQHWRGIVAREQGFRVSLNVAPATRTKSVTKNRVLAAAYDGAGLFGVKVFDPDTTRALMAGILVRDLRDERSSANPSRELTHPSELISDAAAHGGLWRVGYDPRSVLSVAALVGFARP
ncbi:MAG: hypothetical protein KDC39_11540 [Actinobacteria bacterium]|nr:hypothetical protein [Actinomycetota bacterium]